MMPTILQAEGSTWSLEIVGRLPDLPTFISDDPKTSIWFQGTPCLIKVADRKSDKIFPIIAGDSISPIFFESTGYDIYFEYRGSASIKLPLGAEKKRVRQDQEHYVLNFGNHVGYSDIEVSTPSEKTRLRIEVFPRKIDYRTDYRLMRDDISAILRNLAMSAMAQSFSLAAPSHDHRPTLSEWFSILKGNFSDFVRFADVIARHLQSVLRRSRAPRDTNRVRNVSRQTLEKALRHPGSGPAIPSTLATLPRRIEESLAMTSVDTPENRYFKGTLRLTYRNIKRLIDIRLSEDEDADSRIEKRFLEEIRPELQLMAERLALILRAPTLAQVGEGTSERPSSMIFYKSPAYSRFDKVARLLNAGLSLEEGLFNIGTKETSTLYEYWCFVKIIDLLRHRFRIEKQTVIKINHFRTVVTLAKGKPSTITFRDQATGNHLHVVYNKLFDRLPTLAQRPDNVIQIADGDKFYILDAKYRLQFDREYIDHYGGPGPTTEDINTMHRYRDAIAIPHPIHPGSYRSGIVMGAAVLFPYSNEQAYRRHKFFASLSLVEIGGLPFLPSSTRLVEEKLEEIISRSSP